MPGALRPVATAAAACRAADLSVVGGGLVLQGQGNGGTGSVILRNAGGSPCRLTGRPVARFVGAPKMPRQVQVPLPQRRPSFPQVAPPDSTLLALPPGATASVGIDWSNWCVPGARQATKPLVPPRALRLALPGAGGTVDADYNAVVPCVATNRPSTLGVRPFQTTPLPVGRPWTTTRLEARVLSADGEPPPLAAKRGTELRYAVELRNPSRTATVAFDRCPLVAQLLAPAGSLRATLLNCRVADALAPGEAERFEMRLHVPKDAPIGPNGLFWELDPTGAQGPEVVARVVVE